jgi:hypothetical protein
MSETHDFAHLDNIRPEFESEEPPLIDVPPPPSRTKKDELFSSPEAMAYEKGTIAKYDNEPIVRSRVEDEVMPDVPSYFPSVEDTMQIKELEDGGEYH